MSRLYCISASLPRSFLMFCLRASARCMATCLLRMDSCSCWSLSISCWTLASSSSSAAVASYSASSSQSSIRMRSGFASSSVGARGNDWCGAPVVAWLVVALLWPEIYKYFHTPQPRMRHMSTLPPSLGIPYVSYASVHFKCLFIQTQPTWALIDTGGGYHLGVLNL
jgi:hypothetical protein